MPITRKKPASRKSSARRRSSGASRTRQPVRREPAPPPPKPSLWQSIPAERKIDILGVIMAVTGLLTLISLFSVSKSGVTGGWVKLLSGLFGWSVPILAILLVGGGAWLVARRIERLPRLSIERVAGVILLFFNLLTILHGLASGSLANAPAAAEAGRGGGQIGSLILQGFILGLGGAGAVIALAAWFIIAMIMTLDLSVEEMFRWAGPLGEKAYQKLTRLLKRSKTGREAESLQPPPDDFTPLHRPPVALQVATPPGVTVKVDVPAAPVIHWVLPKTADILEMAQAPTVSGEFVEQRARLIEETLASFGAPSQVVEISRGPTITMFGVEPLFVETRVGRTRVRVGKIVSLTDDLALALAAPRIRIQAPVPGRGYVGIEVPNDEMTLVTLREVVESEVFQRARSPLRFALGKDVAGHPMVASLENMPHLLIAGTTGSGKSVCVNSILSSFLLHNTPDDLRLILVDPKRVELSGYNGVPHLLSPVVVEIERVVGALQWMMREMDNRYHKFAQVGARNLQDYNARRIAQGGKKLPLLVVVIDELADLMMIAPDETERTIARLTQMARATGIHLLIATQRPSVDVVTGLIKANFPARIAFAVASGVDSRVILDQPGAERLLGRGDMLFQSPDSPAPVRLQGVFVSDTEINRLVEYWRTQAGASSPYAALGAPGAPADALPSGIPLKQVPMFEEMEAEIKGDPLLNDAIDLVRREGRASVSMLQRRLRIGYTRSARLVDTLEEKGIIGPPEGATGVRQVLDYGPTAPLKED